MHEFDMSYRAYARRHGLDKPQEKPITIDDFDALCALYPD